MKYGKLVYIGLVCIILAAPLTAAAPDNGVQTLFNMTLTGPEMEYRVYLPASLPSLATDTPDTSRNFNQPAAITPFDNPTRIYWELTVSDRVGSKILANPELVIATALEAAGSKSADSQTEVKPWVKESFCGDTRSGSFILPAHTGMAICLRTGASDKRTALFSHHSIGFNCRLTIYYRPADRGLPSGLQHIDAPVFNQYINTMIQSKENTIKASLVNENLYNIVFRKVNFHIESGELLIGFTAFYQGRSVFGIPYRTQAEGTAAFEVRCSGDGSRMGLYCRGLVGSFDIPNDLGLMDRWGKSYIHNKIANQQYWTALPGDAKVPAANEPPPTYLVFKNENLAVIMNQALLAGKLRPISYDFPGGALKISFREISFTKFSLAEGCAGGKCKLDAELALLGQDVYKIENAGTIDPLELDFYIDSATQGWWGRIGGFHIELNGLSAMWNGLVNQIISKKLAESHGLTPLAIPALFPDPNPGNAVK